LDKTFKKGVIQMKEITRRTKKAILAWAELPDDTSILLDDELSRFRPAGLEELRVELNIEFDGENGFPIDSNLWLIPELRKVCNVRDFVLDVIEGKI
jgi:hypothetical protein